MKTSSAQKTLLPEQKIAIVSQLYPKSATISLGSNNLKQKHQYYFSITQEYRAKTIKITMFTIKIHQIT
jgi:hypothetical protein